MDIARDIKITQIECAVIQRKRPRVVGRNSHAGAHGVIVTDRMVRLHTNRNVFGLGWSRANQEKGAQLLGRSLSEVFSLSEGTAEELRDFDLALWDLAGRVLETPVYELVLHTGGGRPCERTEESVPVYDGSIYIDELDPETGRDDGVQPMLNEALDGLSRGFRAFKIKIGRGFKWMEGEAGLQRDVEVIRAVRDAVGSEAKLLVDGNNGFTPEEARQLMDRAGDCDIFWFEEPFPEGEKDCCEFREFLNERGYSTYIADGEGSEGKQADLTHIVRAGGIDVVQFDMRFFGFTRWINYVKEISDVEVFTAPHNWGSHVSAMYIAHFALTTNNFLMGEIDWTPDSDDSPILSEGYEIKDGMMSVPNRPGFGIQVDEKLFGKAVEEKDGWRLALSEA